jgi:hypothetical protein
MQDKEDIQFWRSWLDFLQVALEHDGIRIY